MGLLDSIMGRVSNVFGGLGGGQAGNTANMLSDLDSKYGTSVLGFINNPATVTPTGMVDSATMLKQVNQAAGVQDSSGMLSGVLPSLATPQMPSLSDIDPRKAMNKGALEEQQQQEYADIMQRMRDDYAQSGGPPVLQSPDPNYVDYRGMLLDN